MRYLLKSLLMKHSIYLLNINCTPDYFKKMRILNLKFYSTKRILVSTLLTLLCFNTFAQAWTEVGTGTNALKATGSVASLLIDVSGNIYAAGGFIDGNLNTYVAKWNGTSWSELGTGSNALINSGSFNTIESIAADNSGNIYAAGEFININGKQYVAKWNGTNWTELGFGTNALNANANIYSILVDHIGNVYAAGDFTNSGNSRYVAKWDGTSWSELGTGANALNANATIYKIALDASGNIYAGGYFTDGNGKEYIAKWDGTNWTELGTGTNALNADNFVSSIAIDASGNVYAAGRFSDSVIYSLGNEYVAKWDGTNWTKVGTGTNAIFNGIIRSLINDNAGNLYIAGDFLNTSAKEYVAKWDGGSWSEVGTGTNALNANDLIETVALDGSGNLYAGGFFTDATFHKYVAKYGMTSGVANVPGSVNIICISPNPASNSVAISLNKQFASAEIYITDLIGREIYHSNISNLKHTIDVSTWSNGLYICDLKIDGKKSSAKIVINR